MPENKFGLDLTDLIKLPTVPVNTEVSIDKTSQAVLVGVAVTLGVSAILTAWIISKK